MKKFALLIVALMATVAVMGQNQRLKAALIKDEGGVTNIRKGPGTQYAIVTTIEDGFFINCMPTKGAWTKVYTTYTSDDPQEFVGYISTSKLVYPKRQGSWKQLARVKEEGGYTNIRKGPGTKYPVVKKVKDGSYILWSGDFQDAWYKVYNQQGVFLGYISSSKMQLFDSPAW